MFFYKKEKKLKIDKNKKTIIFDFDGTLADTFEHLLDVIDAYSGDFGVELADKKMLDELRQLSARELFKKFHIPFFLIPFIVNKIQKSMGERIDDIYPFYDVVDAIKKVRNKYNIGLLSTNSLQNLNKFLEKENIKDIFDFVLSEKNVFGKDKPINSIILQNGINKMNIIYIGDEIRDVEACRKVGIEIISVGWGFNSEKILRKINEKNFVSDANQMISKIKQILGD